MKIKKVKKVKRVVKFCPGNGNIKFNSQQCRHRRNGRGEIPMECQRCPNRRT